MPITFNQVKAKLESDHYLNIDSLEILPHQSWAFLGCNGSGKSAFVNLLSQTIPLASGEINGLEQCSIGTVSFEQQQFLINREAERDDSDITNEVFEGTPVYQLFTEVSSDDEAIRNWVNKFNLKHVLQKGFRKLSTGESRKVIIIRALLQEFDLLIFHEPFDGLDINSQNILKDTLSDLQHDGKRFILVLNRLDEVPLWVSHLGFLHSLSLIASGEKSETLRNETVKAYLTFNNQTLTLPVKDISSPQLCLEKSKPLMNLKDGRVAYSDRLIFENLNWTIQSGEHWAVLGPNGCGKSTLLNLISGDHPQCYANNLTVFGIKRGSGESIWDIKQHLGIISASLQWQYKAGTNVISTVVSGLFDSIGLYTQVDDHQQTLALQWLKLVHLDHKANDPLHQLSYGEQRLVLICRAMIKQPALLILDEPCQGLDEPNRQLVLGFIELLSQQRDTTLLYVTHHSTDLLPCFKSRLICESVDGITGSHWKAYE